MPELKAVAASFIGAEGAMAQSGEKSRSQTPTDKTPLVGKPVKRNVTVDGALKRVAGNDGSPTTGSPISKVQSTPESMTPTGSQQPAFQRVRETKDAIIRRTPQMYQNPSLNAISELNQNDYGATRVGAVPGYVGNGDGSVDASASISASISRYKYYNKLAPFPDTPFVMPDHVVPSSFFILIPIKRGQGQSSFVTVFSIWNTMMGTSILALPWAVNKAGFGTAITIILAMGLLTYYTCYLTVKVTSSHPCRPGVVIDFPDVCEYYLGKVGKWTCFVFSIVAFLGALVVYWVLMTNFLFNTGRYIHTAALRNNTVPLKNESVKCDKYNLSQMDHHSKGITLLDTATFSDFWDLQNSCPFWLLLLVFPLINMKSATFFTKFNVLGTVSVAYLFFFVIYHAVKWGPCLEAASEVDPHQHNVVEFRPTFPALCGTLSLAMFIHNGIMAILRNQRKPQNNTRDLSIAYFLVTLTYMFVGVVFYVTFPHLDKNKLPDNFLNFFPSDDVMSVVARAFLLIQMICVFPLLIYILRIQVMHAFFANIWPSLYHILAFNSLLLALCATVACVYPSVGDIIRYAGSLCGLALIFTLPCLVHLLKLREEERLTKKSIVLHSFLILIGVAIFISQFFV